MKWVRQTIGIISLWIGCSFCVFGAESAIVNTEEYQVIFDVQNMQVKCDDEMTVTYEVAKGERQVETLYMTVSNIYPGGGFEIEPKIRNVGKLPVVVDALTFYPVEAFEAEGYKEEAKRLYEALLIEDSQMGPYLTTAYVGQNIDVGEVVSFPVKMRLSPEVTDLQNTATRFAVQISFRQWLPELPETTDPERPPVLPPGGKPEELIPVEDEEVPAGEVTEAVSEEEVPDEEIPAGGVLEEEVEVGDSPIPGGRLPQTGGIPAFVCYVVGIVAITIGVIISKRKKKDR
ncbi:MAG: LPXTG cell wall anchor domain-containing protein [Cellulosilyticaceae bacterium]